MDFSDDEDLYPERDIGELLNMGWTFRTFSGTNRFYMSRMLKLLFDDFHIQAVRIDRVDNIYTPREMTPEQIKWLNNWQEWGDAPSNPPPWPESNSDEFKDDGGRRQSSHGEKKGIFGSLIDLFMSRRLTITK
ncbi:hypothetical protein PspLS_09847 [Pyricularia sp. CBS 133598]|nr:hypothetical protein PspLS_09847 [Pyricularia sp. CBS 133598]